MKSKAFCSNILRPLICENTRRFWPIPVVGFLVYFLSGVFPVLINYDKPEILADYINLSFKNMQPFFMFAHLLLPLTAAVLVFRYLQETSSVSVLHSMPFTRTGLFFGNFLSGLFLTLSPVIANGLIFLLIAKPVYRKEWLYDELTDTSAETMTNVFTRLAVCRWMWESMLIIFFIFALAVLAGMVTGNSLMHFFTALSGNFLVPVFYFTLIRYFKEYLFGFTPTGSPSEFFLYLSPYLRVLAGEDRFPPRASVLYLIVGLAAMALSLFLYHKRKLERAGDSLAFSFLEPVFCYLITFFSMSLFGLYFSMLDERPIYSYAGYAAGTLVGLLLGQMLVKKTVRIFNLPGLKRFSFYCGLAILFFLCLNFDVTGYERRIPDSGSVASVSLEQNFLAGDSLYTSPDPRLKEDKDHFQEKEHVGEVIALHRKLLEDRSLYEAGSGTLRTSTVKFLYHMKDGSLFSRSYNVPVSLLRSYQFLAPLYESPEHQLTPVVAGLPAEAFNYASLWVENYSYTPAFRSEESTLSDKEDIRTLASLIAEDIADRSFADMCVDTVPLGTLEFGFRLRQTSQNISFPIYPDFKRTIGWLSEKGWRDILESSGAYASYMVVEHARQDSESSTFRKALYSGASVDSLDPVSDPSQLVVRDRKQIEEIFSSCENDILDYDDYYMVTLVFPGGYNFYYLNPDRTPAEIRERSFQ